MRFHTSVAGLVGSVVLIAVGIATLQNASSPWASVAFSVALSVLTVALIGVVCRRGERHAFWVGFSLCGWIYLALSSGPGLATSVRPNLVTAKLLDWAYPRLVPEERRPTGSRPPGHQFSVPVPALGEGLAHDNLTGTHVDVLARREREESPTRLIEDVAVIGVSSSGGKVTRAVLDTSPAQFAQLTQAQTEPSQFILLRHRPGWFSEFPSSSQVGSNDFQNCGHSLFALLAAWIGGALGRFFSHPASPHA